MKTYTLPRRVDFAGPVMQGYSSSLNQCLAMLQGHGLVSDKTLKAAEDELARVRAGFEELSRLKFPEDYARE